MFNLGTVFFGALALLLPALFLGGIKNNAIISVYCSLTSCIIAVFLQVIELSLFFYSRNFGPLTDSYISKLVGIVFIVIGAVLLNSFILLREKKR